MRRVLIANRGEIAVRVIRACRRLGLESVAVYSAADRAALAVRMADFAYEIGPAAPSESYLSIDTIIDTAKRAGADAIHPGYGFLSENPVFAKRVVDAGLIWVGPPAEAIALMGDKIAARQLMMKRGVPVVPGSPGPITDPDIALAEASKSGFPILLKAVAGGGGKGMRLVTDPEMWHASFEAATREAERGFGDGRVYWEKYVLEPHHIEIQILSGPDKKAIALGERECSIQRRHQKVIEESPSPIVTPELRQQMCEAAVAAAEGCGYIGAGTVEFLVDVNREFYFLEMNTRLQVEHPVTEAVTGCDLVIEQFRIASGSSWTPPSLPDKPFGHAIEFRIYAEDPQNNYLPSPGTLSVYREPQGPGVRVDSGVYQGAEVPVYYDPMIAKLVVWGRDRTEAIARARAALEEFAIGGVATTIAIHRRVAAHPAYAAGDTTTDFLDRHFSGNGDETEADDGLRQALAVAATLYARHRVARRSRLMAGGAHTAASPWLAAARRQGIRRWSQ